MIYTDPPYDVVWEFRASNSPVDWVFAVGEPNIRQLFGGGPSPFGYEIRIPVFIFTTDKNGVTSAKLKWAMEAELRRVCEKYRVAHGANKLEKRDDRYERRGNIVLHSAEYILTYKRGISA